MDFFIILFFWLSFAIIVGVAANSRGRSGFGWFLLAVVISPLLAGLLVFARPRRRVPIDFTNEKVCPYCAERIQQAAIKCRYCGSSLAEPANVSAPELSDTDLLKNPPAGAKSFTYKNRRVVQLVNGQVIAETLVGGTRRFSSVEEFQEFIT